MNVWWGDPEQDWGHGDARGRRRHAVPGNGVVIIGMSERTLAPGDHPGGGRLFEAGAAEQVIVAGMPKLRAAMHLDTVFTFADRDVATAYREIVDGIHAFTLRPADDRPGST